MKRLPAFMRTPSGATGCALLLILIGVALLGPVLAPHSIDGPVGAPGQPPGDGLVLGADFLGRDVLSRVLHGGMSVLLLSTVATVLSSIIGAAIGMFAGYGGGITEAALMRGVDLLLSFPALLVLLLLVAGLGVSVPVLLLGIVLVNLPGIARLSYGVTQDLGTRGYVETAVARGERVHAIVGREILPNMFALLIADFGIRFAYIVILVASMNFLGLGLQPPSPDWGVMIAENRNLISLNIWSVLAPAALLGLLTISVNLIGDAYVQTHWGEITAGPEQGEGEGRLRKALSQ